MKYWSQKPLLGTPLNTGKSISEGLVSAWILNEGSGNKVYDASGNNNTGIIKSSLKWTYGLKGSAIQGGNTYDDANNIIDCGNTIDPRSWKGISIVVFADYASAAASTYPALLSNVTTGNYYGNYNFTTEAANTIMWRPGGNSSGIKKIIDYSGIHQLVATWSLQSVGNIYVDSKLQSTGSMTNGWDSNNYSTTINGYYRNSEWRTNRHIYFAILLYNRALTAAEIQQLYLRPFSPWERDPIELWTPTGGEPPETPERIMTTMKGYW